MAINTLAGKHAIITGAGTGVGAATALALAAKASMCLSITEVALNLQKR